MVSMLILASQPVKSGNNSCEKNGLNVSKWFGFMGVVAPMFGFPSGSGLIH